MNLKSLLAKPFSSYIYNQVKKGMETAVTDQENILKDLIKNGRKTLFGKEYKFDDINSYDDFKTKVPIRDYEQLKHYIEKIKEGQQNILWKGKPIYFAKT